MNTDERRLKTQNSSVRSVLIGVHRRPKPGFPIRAAKLRLLVLALAGLSSSVWAQCELADSSPKVRPVREVFDQLVRAADIADRVQLAVVETNCAGRQNRFEGAWFDPAHRKLSLDVGLYDLCAARPDSTGCLAFLLGHELGHVSQTINRLSGFAGPDAESRVDSAENARREADADLRGGVFGYRAGFDSLRNAAEILQAVYDKYNLNQKLEGYPSLDERKAGVNSALAELRRLIPVFEAANLLLILGNYDVAADCYESIARRFRSREIYNNKGVAYALWLASLADPKQLPPYPWILDSSSRLNAAGGGSRGEAGTLTNAELFERGLGAFEEAKRLDPDYVPAYVNAACLYDLNNPKDRHALNELDDAGDHLKDDVSLKAFLQLARGILSARRGKTADAEAALKEARDAGAPAAAALLKLLADGKPPVLELGGSREVESTDEEQIGERTPSSLLRSKGGEESVLIEGDVPFRVGPAKEYGDEFGTLIVQRAGTRWAFVATRAGYQGKTAHDIGLGATRSAVESAYCGPAEAGRFCGAELRTAGGTFVHFTKARVIFLLDARNQVARWTLYGKR